MLIPVMIIVFTVTLAIGVPIAFSIYFTSFGALLTMKIPTVVLVQRVIGGIEKYPLLCVPFFILAGSFMSAGGITQRIVQFSNLLVGRFSGALGLVDVLACMFFAGISGSAIADATSVGAILIPAMKKEGYSPKFAGAITASAAVCGPIIPPSIPMVILGIVCGMSIGRLFIAAALPGIMLGLSLMIGAYISAVRNNYPKHRAASLKEVLWGVKEGGTALLMPVIIVLGITTGVVTDAEVGALAAIYALIVGVFVHRELNLQKIVECLKETVVSTGIVLFIMGAASLFAWLLTVSGIPKHISQWIFSITTNKILILVMINIFLLIVGCFMEGVAAILLLAPILMPLATSIGMDPIHFGVMMVFNLMLGLLTPPVGMTLYIAMRFAEISLV